MAIYGYMRVSKKKQSEGRQVAALEKYAKEREIEYKAIFLDKYTRKKFDRPQYNAMKDILQAEDEVIIKELDRLGGNYEEMKKEMAALVSRNVKLTIIDFPVMMSGIEDLTLRAYIYNNILELLSYVADKELERIQMRVQEGIDKARADGKKLGRPKIALPKNFEKYYNKHLEGQITVTDLGKLIGKSRTTTYRYITMYKEQLKKDLQLDINGHWNPIEREGNKK